MFRSARSLLATAFVALVLGIASASPHTAFLDALRADLVVRQTVLGSLPDPISQIRLAVATAAIGNIDESDSGSLYGDIKVLRKVAIKIEKAFGVNDGALVGALTPFLDASDANLVALRVRIASVTSPKLAAKATVLADSAEALLAVARNPVKKKAKNVTARSTALRDAQKAIDTANAKIDHASAPGACNGDGRLTASVDDAPFAPPYAAVQRVLDGQDALLSVQVSGYYYNPNAQDPYAQGTIDLLWSAVSFTGVGTYQVSDSGTPTVLSQQGGVLYHSTAGSIHLTTYDETSKIAEGTFECTLTDNSGTVTKVVTNGSFKVCRFVNVH